MAYLVTGAAGFIGFHVALRLLQLGHDVVGFDDMNPYYDPALKRARVAELVAHRGFRMVEADLADRAAVEAVFSQPFAAVIHLAAQAGVRHGIDQPHVYAAANLTGFLHILEGCRHGRVPHLVYASSSSVYGSGQLPFSEHDAADHPLSLYAATKRANELMAHSYAHLFGLPATGLRFFTVYGPWGRPDMAIYKFTRALLADEPIVLFNHGAMSRDMTYIDDVVEAVIRVIDRPPTSVPVPDLATAAAPWRLYNVGNADPVDLMTLVATIEAATGRTAKTQHAPLAAGDAIATAADATDLFEAVGFRPATPLAEGVRRFVAWYRSYHGLPERPSRA